jgi:hypothetical protein
VGVESQTPHQPRAEVAPIEVTVAFDPGAGPVSGVVGGADSPTRIHGWLELMDALDAARSLPAEAGETER